MKFTLRILRIHILHVAVEVKALPKGALTKLKQSLSIHCYMNNKFVNNKVIHMMDVVVAEIVTVVMIMTMMAVVVAQLRLSL